MSLDYQKARAEVALLALPHAPEETFSETCPKCNAPEKKLSVTRTHNGALFVCHRASCGFRGFVAMDDNGSKDIPRTVVRPPRPYRGEIFYLDDRREVELSKKYHLRETLYWASYGVWATTKDGDELLFRCRGFHGELIGHVSRSADKTIRTWRAREGSSMYSFYHVHPRATTVLVEDCISAICVAEAGYNSVALLGTSMPEEVEQYLKNKPVVVYLDPDAEPAALAIQRRLPLAAVVLGQALDPKDNPHLPAILMCYL